MNVAPAQLLIFVPRAGMSFKRIARIGSGKGAPSGAWVYAISQKALGIITRIAGLLQRHRRIGSKHNELFAANNAHPRAPRPNGPFS